MSADLDFKDLFDATPLPRFVIRRRKSDGWYVLEYANEKAISTFNRYVSIKPGMTPEEFLDPDTASHFLRALDSAIELKRPVPLKISSALPGGRQQDNFLMNAISYSESDVLIDVMVIPVSDSSSLQRERDDAISLLTSVFDVSEVGIVVTDRHHRVVRINDSFVRIYGWKREEMIGREFIDLVSPDERDQARRSHEEFMESGIRSSGEMRLIRKDGSFANALFTTAALELSHGRRFQVTTIMDISLRKQMEVSLRLAKEQADSANQAKSTFLANMSHELRTPLNAIIGFSEMMMKETFGPLANDKYVEYLGDIHVSARHLLEIINEVLDMSKIEAGKVELDEEYFDVGGLVAGVIRMMDSRAFSGGLKIKDRVDPDLPPLFADPRLVRQILINLVGNAVKYTSAGGVVEVIARREPDGALQLVVTDTGRGIPKDKIREALEPFGQVNKSVESGSIQGTGLGLPLAKAMAELHGGTLNLESDVGQGTMVTVQFPARRLAARPPKGQPSSPLSPLKKPAKIPSKVAGATEQR